jgi:hypothetical protein
MTRPELYEEDEERRRRVVFWFFFGTLMVVLLFTGSWIAMGGAKPESSASGKPQTSASPSPTAGPDVVVGTPQLGAQATTSGGVTAPQAAGGNGQGNNGNGNGGSTGGSSPGHSLNVSGVVQGTVAPNRPATLVVTINNPNSQDILVTSVTGSVTSVTTAHQAGKPVCSTAWYQVGSFSGSLLVPKGASRTVSVPVSFLNSATINQDNCKGQQYTYSFTAQARQA